MCKSPCHASSGWLGLSSVLSDGPLTGVPDPPDFRNIVGGQRAVEDLKGLAPLQPHVDQQQPRGLPLYLDGCARAELAQINPGKANASHGPTAWTGAP